MNRHVHLCSAVASIVAVGLLSIGLLTGCDGMTPPTTPVDRLAEIAEQAAQEAAAQTTDPHEIKMIEYKRELMGKPGLQMYIVFLNDMGQPIDYFMTQGKCSSSNKRLTKSWKFNRGQTGIDGDGHAVQGDFVFPVSDIDGTHGRSDTYVFCKTVDGKYKQWNGRYYLSDAPIELTIKPLVVDVSGRNQQQQ